MTKHRSSPKRSPPFEISGSTLWPRSSQHGQLLHSWPGRPCRVTTVACSMTSWRYEARSLALALCIVTIVLTTNLVQLQSLGLASCKPQTVARALGNGQGTARFDELARRAAAAREADRVDEAIGL